MSFFTETRGKVMSGRKLSMMSKEMMSKVKVSKSRAGGGGSYAAGRTTRAPRATALTPVIHEEEEEASSSSLGAAVAEAPRKSSVISLAGQRKNSMALMSNAPLSQFNAKCTAAAAAMPIHHVLELASGRFMAINMKRRCTASLTARGDGGEERVVPEERVVEHIVVVLDPC